MTSKLLPPNATKVERALVDAISRIGEVDVPLAKLWDADSCPVELLPWLAWSVGVDEWNSGWSEEQKRIFVRESIALKQHKGTPWAIKEAFSRPGYGDVSIQEGFGAVRYDGEEVYGGRSRATYSGEDRWWLFEIITPLPEAGIAADELKQLLRLVKLYGNTRSHLATIRFTLSFEDAVQVEEELLTTTYHFKDYVPLLKRYDGRTSYAGDIAHDSERDDLVVIVMEV